jgi:hypothetical protein
MRWRTWSPAPVLVSRRDRQQREKVRVSRALTSISSIAAADERLMHAADDIFGWMLGDNPDDDPAQFLDLRSRLMSLTNCLRSLRCWSPSYSTATM